MIHRLSLATVLAAALLVALIVWGGPRSAAAPTSQRAVVSFYGPGLFGNRTACGQTLRPWTQGVAHRSLPCGTRLQFQNRNGVWVTVRVVDRGPYVWGRTFDLTSATHSTLGLACGVCVVTYRKASR